MAEGQTATNRQTGERVVLRGGQWVPLGGAAARPAATGGLTNPVSAITGAAGNARISSAYRDPQRNRQAGGAANSYHTRGQALDLVPQGGETMAQLEARMRGSGLPFRELLNEGDHIHVAWDGDQLTPDQTVDYFNRGGSQVAAPTEQAVAPTGRQVATNPQTGEQVELINGAWVPVNTVDPRSGAITVEEIDPAREARMQDPEYQRAFADAQRGSANVPEALRAFGQGQTLGFLEEITSGINQGIQGAENIGRRAMGQEVRYGADVAAQAMRDSERDAQAAYAKEKPVQNFALQLGGGLFTPGVGQAGRYIEGAQGAARMARAAGVGAGIGVGSGLGNSEGDLVERAPDAAMSGLIGAGTGVIGQRAIDGLTRRVAGDGGGAARRLSRQGVRLTPGQMVSETPFVGEFIRNAEDVAGGFNPLMAGVRGRQNEDVVRAAGNEALGYIGESLPRNARTGYQVSQNISRVLGDRYDDVTSRITAQADSELGTDLADLTARAAQTLDDSNLRRLERILNDKFVNEFEASGQLTGDSFKRIERALREQSERASRPTSTLADNDLAEFLDEARDVARNLIARQYPEEAATIQSLNRGWATNKIIERAVTGSAGFSRSGTPTPGEISQAVVNSSSRGAIANENALLQGLATDARTVLPSTVPDSGTAQKTLLAGAAGAIGAGGASFVAPGLAPLIAAGAVVYSRPGIALLNGVYRATDSRAANVALRELAQQAQENPALLPYYEAALQHVTGRSPRETQAAPQSPQQSQPPSPALQRVLQP